MKTTNEKPNMMLAVWTAVDRELSREGGRDPKTFTRRSVLSWLSHRILAAVEVKPGRIDIVGALIAYESGNLDEEQVVELFQVLVSTRVIYSLQGSYQRRAADLVQAGLVQVN